MTVESSSCWVASTPSFFAAAMSSVAFMLARAANVTSPSAARSASESTSTSAGSAPCGMRIEFGFGPPRRGGRRGPRFRPSFISVEYLPLSMGECIPGTRYCVAFAVQFGGDERTLRQPLPLVKSPKIRARDYFPEVAFAQSDLKIAIPLSVSGCFVICSSTLSGIVATCAPASADSVTCRGWRIDAARISQWSSPS